MNQDPTPDIDIASSILRGAAELGVPCSEVQAEALADHLRLVFDANRTMNLTRIADPESAVSLHVLDSIAAVPTLERLAPGAMLDMGAGAGFPGIPLAVLTGRRVTLVESVKKKARFLADAVQSLRLEVSVSELRAEELAVTMPGAFSIVTARALSALPSLIELAAPFLVVGGSLVAYKGTPDEAEIAQGDRAAKLVGMRRTARVGVALPGSPVARELVIYERVGKSGVRLPRRTGLAQTSPLG